MENHFRRTVPLSLLTHPETQPAWPNWAVLAYVHTLDPSVGCNDLYVTYSSTCQHQEDPSDRETLDGISIDVKRLWIWDWGPVEKDVQSVVFDEDVPVRIPDNLDVDDDKTTEVSELQVC